jgi:mono/diheme cytochrome c family protein
MRHVYLVTLFVCVLLVSILGLRGTKFTSPPLDVFPEWAFPGMKYQPRLRPQSESKFFADGSADRMPVAHTVARGALHEDDAFYAGKDASGQWIKGFPASVNVDKKFLEHGRERYTIYCQPCHGMLGDGQGITAKYGMASLPVIGNYHTDRIRQMTEGQLYNTIVNGSESKVMLPYADKLSPEDRWAVVAYVRALQRAQQGKVADVDQNNAQAKKDLGL